MRRGGLILLALVCGCPGDDAVEPSTGSSSSSGVTPGPAPSTSTSTSTNSPETTGTTGTSSSTSDSSGTTSIGTTEGSASSTSSTDSGSSSSTVGSGSDSGSTTGSSDTDPGSTSGTESGSTESSSDSGSDSDSSDSGPVFTDSTILFEEFFDDGIAPSWPAPWQVLGGITTLGVDGAGRGWFIGEVFNVGRIGLPGFFERDAEITATIVFSNVSEQGAGLYMRQNGGWLDNSVPPGRGYVAFLEGHGTDALGFWREVNGVEELLISVPVPALVNGTAYRLRFQCEQIGASTEMRARLWIAANPEPAGWDLVHTDNTPDLQNVAGSFAVDLFNYSALDVVEFDDIVIRTLDP